MESLLFFCKKKHVISLDFFFDGIEWILDGFDLNGFLMDSGTFGSMEFGAAGKCISSFQKPFSNVETLKLSHFPSILPLWAYVGSRWDTLG